MWVATSCVPQISWDTMVLSTRFGKARAKDLRELAKLIRYVKEEECSITIPSLGDVEDWTVFAHGDGAHANLEDKVSSSVGKLVNEHL